jgi:hypothetical protein
MWTSIATLSVAPLEIASEWLLELLLEQWESLSAPQLV